MARSPLSRTPRPTAPLLGRAAVDAVRRARAGGGGPVLAAAVLDVASDWDPAAVAFAARRAGEPLWVVEQPDRDGRALAGLGAVASLSATGPDRFASVAAAWRRVAGRACGEGVLALGGFAFAPDGAGSPTWEGFPAASLTVPEATLVRDALGTRLVLAARADPDDTPEDLEARVADRWRSLQVASLPLLDPAPVGRTRVVSALAPEHYEEAVGRAVERIRGREFEKIVLAREVQVHASVDHDPAAVHGVLREAFPSCFTYCVARGDAAFLGASPELLVRREGQRASTVALAGSARRSADPAVDDHLGERLLRSDKDREEQAIVTRRIERTLLPHAVWVTAAPEPVVMKVANIQHLATPIRAQLAEAVDVVDLAGHLHPTPAIGAEPRSAVAAIPGLEGLDRGWYAGTIGWTDAHGDGEFCVALRCALLRGPVAHCYAGVGVVRDSDPAAELAETEIKLGALLPVLAS